MYKNVLVKFCKTCMLVKTRANYKWLLTSMHNILIIISLRIMRKQFILKIIYTFHILVKSILFSDIAYSIFIVSFFPNSFQNVSAKHTKSLFHSLPRNFFNLFGRDLTLWVYANTRITNCCCSSRLAYYLGQIHTFPRSKNFLRQSFLRRSVFEAFSFHFSYFFSKKKPRGVSLPCMEHCFLTLSQ